MKVHNDKYDFAGWATKNDLLCSDGRTIRRNAFTDNDGMTVPLVWSHDHTNPSNVLGHVKLTNTPEGVWAEGKFNDSYEGEHAKTAVRNGDIKHLSIYANHLVQNGGDVLHGNIKEVSLVLNGANPGAMIEFPLLEHGEESDTEAIIYTGEPIMKDKYLSHSDDITEEQVEAVLSLIDAELSHEDVDDDTLDILNSMTDEQIDAVARVIDDLDDDYDDDDDDLDDYDDDYDDDDDYVEHEDDDDPKPFDSIEEFIDSLDDSQKLSLYGLLGAIGQTKSVAHSDDDNNYYEGDFEMKRNVFDDDNNIYSSTLSHEDVDMIFENAKSLGSLKEAVYEAFDDITLAHDDDEITYGIDNIDYLFPDARALTSTPEFIRREDAWVSNVMNSTHHSPFSRIKSIFADLREDDARAKGYLKGNVKKEEYFSLIRRTVQPTTIYKKQKLDRDDILDITDFDVVVWLKQEMRIMLDEEIARAILIGDGRLPSDTDRINPANVIPIWTDDPQVYTINVVLEEAEPNNRAKEFIKKVIKARKEYKGSGNPVLYAPDDIITDLLLLEDGVGRRLYDTEDKLATALRVSKIVSVPVMENQTRTVTIDNIVYNRVLDGIIVNLTDYNVGSDKGGDINFFGDFDIDYNQEKFLLETRISGALTKPFSAIIIEHNQADESGSDEG